MRLQMLLSLEKIVHDPDLQDIIYTPVLVMGSS